MLLTTAIILLAVGWIAERRFYRERLSRSRDAVSRLSEILAIQGMAVTFQKHKDVNAFRKSLEIELVFTVLNAFKASVDLDQMSEDYRLGYGFILANTSMQLLKCNSLAQFRDLALSTGVFDDDEEEFFLEFSDSTSQEYKSFDFFLKETFEVAPDYW